VTVSKVRFAKANRAFFVYTGIMILYPTETIYGLGVNPFDATAVKALFALKGRDERKVSAWLVRNLDDMTNFAQLSATAKKIAERFLPGQLTLVLPAKSTVPPDLQSDSGTIGLRISADPLAQELIERFYQSHSAPLTCTSANVSGLATESTVEKILQQFSTYRPEFTGFDEVIDGGERTGQSSTVVRVDGDKVLILRMGAISEADIYQTLE
jgi:L-threonylcarbamoyladenylate synthase